MLSIGVSPCVAGAAEEDEAVDAVDALDALEVVLPPPEHAASTIVSEATTPRNAGRRPTLKKFEVVMLTPGSSCERYLCA
jgi:hypothetical protein